jgi:hypothetical protein
MKSILYLLLLLSGASIASAQHYAHHASSSSESWATCFGASMSSPFAIQEPAFPIVPAVTSTITNGSIAVSKAHPVDKLTITENATGDILHLSLPDKACFLAVWNWEGKTIYEQRLTGSEIQINVASWKNGEYVLHCAYGVSTIARNFVVRH